MFWFIHLLYNSATSLSDLDSSNHQLSCLNIVRLNSTTLILMYSRYFRRRSEPPSARKQENIRRYDWGGFSSVSPAWERERSYLRLIAGQDSPPESIALPCLCLFCILVLFVQILLIGIFLERPTTSTPLTGIQVATTLSIRQKPDFFSSPSTLSVRVLSFVAVARSLEIQHPLDKLPADLECSLSFGQLSPIDNH